MSEVGRETSQGFVPHKFWVDVVILEHKQTVWGRLLVRQYHQTNAWMQTWKLVMSRNSHRFYHQLSGKTAKKHDMSDAREKKYAEKQSFASSVKCEGTKKILVPRWMM